MRSEKHHDIRKQDLLTTAPPRDTNSIPLPTSAEMMRKSLDKFGQTFHPTPQVAQKGGGVQGSSPMNHALNQSKTATPDIQSMQQTKQMTPSQLLLQGKHAPSQQLTAQINNPDLANGTTQIGQAPFMAPSPN